jgi:hypothetical protein
MSISTFWFCLLVFFFFSVHNLLQPSQPVPFGGCGGGKLLLLLE